MKKLIATLLIAAFASAPAYAGFCENVAAMARETMTYRQQGLPLQTLIEVTRQSCTEQEFCDTWIGAMTDMALNAYDEPRFQTPEYQQMKITEFENLYYGACLEQTL